MEPASKKACPLSASRGYNEDIAAYLDFLQRALSRYRSH